MCYIACRTTWYVEAKRRVLTVAIICEEFWKLAVKKISEWFVSNSFEIGSQIFGCNYLGNQFALNLRPVAKPGAISSRSPEIIRAGMGSNLLNFTHFQGENENANFITSK